MRSVTHQLRWAAHFETGRNCRPLFYSPKRRKENNAKARGCRRQENNAKARGCRRQGRHGRRREAADSQAVTGESRYTQLLLNTSRYSRMQMNTHTSDDTDEYTTLLLTTDTAYRYIPIHTDTDMILTNTCHNTDTIHTNTDECAPTPRRAGTTGPSCGVSRDS